MKIYLIQLITLCFSCSVLSTRVLCLESLMDNSPRQPILNARYQAQKERVFGFLHQAQENIFFSAGSPFEINKKGFVLKKDSYGRFILDIDFSFNFECVVHWNSITGNILPLESIFLNSFSLSNRSLKLLVKLLLIQAGSINRVIICRVIFNSFDQTKLSEKSRILYNRVFSVFGAVICLENLELKRVVGMLNEMAQVLRISNLETTNESVFG